MAKLMKSFYVDDVVTGASDEEQAFALYQILKKVLHEGGFNLRPNSVLLQVKIDSEEASSSQSSAKTKEVEETYSSSTLSPTQVTQSGEREVLGVRWDVASDQFVMSLEDIALLASKVDPTKRAIVSLSASFMISYDFSLQSSSISRSFYKSYVSHPLAGKLLEEWRFLSFSLHESQPFMIPRCYLIGVGE